MQAQQNYQIQNQGLRTANPPMGMVMVPPNGNLITQPGGVIMTPQFSNFPPQGLKTTLNAPPQPKTLPTNSKPTTLTTSTQQQQQQNTASTPKVQGSSKKVFFTNINQYYQHQPLIFNLRIQSLLLQRHQENCNK